MSKLCDPRPDLSEDSVLWNKLLIQARMYYGAKLYDLLHSFRAAGTRIKRAKSGGYVIRPEIGDPLWAWESQEEYDQFKKFLEPHRNKIATLLKRL